MALTQISTAGVKDDAVTSGKIPANAVGSSELADDAVDTNAIVDDAVTADKLANSINTAIAANTTKTSNATHTGDVTGSTSLTIANDAVTTAKIADDAVTTAKIGSEQVTASEIAGGTITAGKLGSNSVTTAKIADEAVTLAKLPHGDGSSDGKFLRANNGADPTFEALSTTFSGLTDTTVSTSDPTATTNPSSGVGHLWVNKNTGDVYVCTNATSNDNQWLNVGDRSGGINQKSAIQSHDNTWFYARFDDAASVSGSNIQNMASGSSALNVTIPVAGGNRTSSAGSTTLQYSSLTEAARHDFSTADPMSPSTHGLTMGALFKKSSASNDLGVMYYGGTGTDNHFFWRTDFNGDNLLAVGEDTGSTDVWTTVFTGVNDNEWIFAVVSIDTNGTLRASRDGAAFSVARSNGTAPTPTNAHFGIQGDMYNDNDADHEFAAFFFYKGVMTDAQVAAEYTFLSNIYSLG